GRTRVVRQLLTESVVLSLAGAVLGLLFAYGGVKGLVASLPTNVPRADKIAIDGRVLLFTAAVAVLTGRGLGIAAAWKGSRLDLQEPLREGGGGSVGPGHRRVRSGLVVAEISLALILLVGAGLLIRSFYRVLQADAGFRADGVLIANLPLSAARFGAHEKGAFAERVGEALGAVPGVEAASLALPLLGGWQSSFTVEGQPEPPPGQRPSADITRVAGDYFRAMGVRVLQGRVFDGHDRADAPPVAVVDETFVRSHFPGESPLGKRISCGGRDDEDEPWLEIVGVVAHTKNYGVDEASRVEVYRPYLQSSAGGSLSAILRTSGDPGGLTAAVRQTIRALD